MQKLSNIQKLQIISAVAAGTPKIAAFRAARLANTTGRPTTVFPSGASDPTARITFYPAARPA